MNREDIRLPISMIGEPEHILDRYRDLIEAGESPGIASILASRKSPELETATNHYVGIRPLAEVAGKDYAAFVEKQAKAAGIPITEHSRYNPSVADKRKGGDPGAWVHNGESPDKLRRTCEDRGVVCEDLRTSRDTSRMSEIEAKREAGIKQRAAAKAARQEQIADKMQKAGVPV